MIFGFLFLIFADSDITANAVADRTTMRLSDRATLTISLEGPAPLSVTVPAEWLAGESSSTWRMRSLGDATVTPLANGRERWTMKLRIDPYATGDPLALTLNPIAVRAGQNSALQTVPLPAVSIKVTTDIQSVQPSEARSITGIESVPEPGNNLTVVKIAIGVIVLALAVGIFFIWKRRTGRQLAASAEDLFAKQLAELDRETDPRQLAMGIASIMRGTVARHFGLKLDCRTANESSLAFRELTSVPESVSRDEFAAIMQECERIQYDPSASGDGRKLLERAKIWLETLKH